MLSIHNPHHTRRKFLQVGSLAVTGLMLPPFLDKRARAEDNALNFPEVSQLSSVPDLPDPLVLMSGERVTTKEQWFAKRRPELKHLFQHYMYGYAPPAPEKITSKVEREDHQACNGKATLKEVTVAFGPPAVPAIHLLLVIPNNGVKPAPLFLGMNFCGNHALMKDPAVRLPTPWIYSNYPGVQNNRATEAGRGTQIDVWAIEQSIDRG
jgi:hypothetical protein